VLAATFSADGSRIFTAARGAGHVWHPEKANKRGDLEELGDDVRQFAAGPFGVAAGCSDGAVRIYQGDGKLPWLTLTGHHDAVQSLAVAPRSEWIASGSADGEVIIWSLDCATWLTRFTAVPNQQSLAYAKIALIGFPSAACTGRASAVWSSVCGSMPSA